MKRPRYVISRANDEMYAVLFSFIFFFFLFFRSPSLSCNIPFTMPQRVPARCKNRHPVSTASTLPHASLQTLIAAAIKTWQEVGARGELPARHRASEKPFEYSSDYGFTICLPFLPPRIVADKPAMLFSIALSSLTETKRQSYQ